MPNLRVARCSTRTPGLRTTLRGVVAALALWAPREARSQDPLAPIRNAPRASVLVIGVFHFQDAGLDSYKPQFPFDVRAPERQREVEDVVARIAAWGPTRIAVEARPERQSRLDSLFAIYPANGLDTVRNEIHQLGFRLAKRLGLNGVMAIDAPGRSLDSTMTEAEWQRRQRALSQGPLSATDWEARFRTLYRADDSLKTVNTLRETLLYVNSLDRLAAGHGHYLVGNLFNGGPGDYFGADGFVSSWYNRNLRIYSNIVRLIRTPEERVLVIFGAGHVPILRHALLSSPAVRLVEVADVLR